MINDLRFMNKVNVRRLKVIISFELDLENNLMYNIQHEIDFSETWRN